MRNFLSLISFIEFSPKKAWLAKVIQQVIEKIDQFVKYSDFYGSVEET